MAVVVAAQPAILYGYGLWTGVKELAAALSWRVGRARLRAPSRRERARLDPARYGGRGDGRRAQPRGASGCSHSPSWLLVDSRASLHMRRVAIAGAILIAWRCRRSRRPRGFLGDGHGSRGRDEDDWRTCAVRSSRPGRSGSGRPATFGCSRSGTARPSCSSRRRRARARWRRAVVASRDALLPYAGCAPSARLSTGRWPRHGSRRRRSQ